MKFLVFLLVLTFFTSVSQSSPIPRNRIFKTILEIIKSNAADKKDSDKNNDNSTKSFKSITQTTNTYKIQTTKIQNQPLITTSVATKTPEPPYVTNTLNINTPLTTISYKTIIHTTHNNHDIDIDVNPNIDPNLINTIMLDQNTNDPNAVDPNAVDPNAVDPNAVDPNAVDPNAVDPNAVDPNAVDPNAVDPNAVDPNAVDPNAVDPNAVDPNAVDSNAVNTDVFESSSSDLISVEIYVVCSTISTSYLYGINSDSISSESSRNAVFDTAKKKNIRLEFFVAVFGTILLL
ncbi:uncharacterized protein ASCRUDRAFT_82974 [Ascoidea rubescens DSM 1968]|uniref:Uncharacterized protein n=1 Tax=Ascoidea rubescens DSM 1968 TaxID=1344418 RepID=A0A1D2V974_9ASCO|nr:hypothetical protein ASCRUDRAFT_82974 [Ascoidea rubescens DSM 1968]ODV58178.1 hypothetical protein ASCRUDRAFT_82974 [Ascoidea rubescens DSM 1968]